jgi:hypothetical protein
MLTALRLGRFGPIFVSLNYTWLFTTVLGLWWLALLWLPENYPQWSHGLHWLVAVLVMMLFLLCVILREMVRAWISGAGRRTITLYPFGAATPYSLRRIDTSRLIASTAAALLTSLALGGALLLISRLFSGDGAFSDVVMSIAIPLGWANLWVGLLNLLPAMPFDGARLLSYVFYWFTGQLDTGLRVTRAFGEAASLILVLVGAWWGLTTQSWLEALMLVVAGWAAREAEENGKQRGMLRNAFAQIRVRDVMDATRPDDAVQVDDSIAHMVRSHSRHAPDALIPVHDNANGLAGIVTVGAADALLQGDWRTTPVLALMTSPRDVEALDPDTPLSKAVEMVEESPLPPEEQPSIPVIEKGMLVGGVDPARLEAFEEVDLELGAEGPGGRTENTSRWGSRLGSIIPAVMVLAAMAILGNAAINADPYSLGGTGSGVPLAFTELQPLPDSVVEVGHEGSYIHLEANIATGQQVMTATISLDGTPLETTLKSHAEGKYLAFASAGPPAPGLHIVDAIAVTRGASLERVRWEFWVGAKGTPTPVPGVETLKVLHLRPTSGALVLANEPGTALSMEIEWPQAPVSAALLLDGEDLVARILPLEEALGRYVISAEAPALAPGEHRVRVQIGGSPGTSYSTEWFFTALLPGDGSADAEYVYFKETGYFVRRAVADYWQANGGLAIFGYPISDRRQETDKDSGKTYFVQYFERARIEEHPAPEGEGNGTEIMLGRLGVAIYEPEAPTTVKEGARFFPETGHNLSGAFRAFWEKNGGLPLFGYPISEVKQEVNPDDGKEYLVQYFERARLELPLAGEGTAAEVQVGLLGAILEGR